MDNASDTLNDGVNEIREKIRRSEQGIESLKLILADRHKAVEKVEEAIVGMSRRKVGLETVLLTIENNATQSTNESVFERRKGSGDSVKEESE